MRTGMEIRGKTGPRGEGHRGGAREQRWVRDTGQIQFGNAKIPKRGRGLRARIGQLSTLKAKRTP